MDITIKIHTYIIIILSGKLVNCLSIHQTTDDMFYYTRLYYYCYYIIATCNIMHTTDIGHVDSMSHNDLR